MINRENFYNGFRQKFGKLVQPKVNAINFLLEKFDESELFDSKGKIAYAFATILRETADTFEPVKEGYWITKNRVQKLYNYYYNHNRHALNTIFPNGLAGKNYLGRGRIQTTHNYNYKNIGDKLGIDLLNNPDLALDNETDWKILELGFSAGIWTGKKLSNYINDDIVDYYNARKIVNGLDHAREIANDAEKFYNIIEFS